MYIVKCFFFELLINNFNDEFVYDQREKNYFFIQKYKFIARNTKYCEIVIYKTINVVFWFNWVHNNVFENLLNATYFSRCILTRLNIWQHFWKFWLMCNVFLALYFDSIEYIKMFLKIFVNVQRIFRVVFWFD